MAKKATEKLTEGLAMFLEGFAELKQSVEAEFGDEEDAEDEESEEDGELEAALVTEVRGVLEIVLENDEFSTEDLATAISSVTEALEEIDPDVFESDEEEADEDAIAFDDDEEDFDDDDMYEDIEEIDEDDDDE